MSNPENKQPLPELSSIETNPVELGAEPNIRLLATTAIGAVSAAYLGSKGMGSSGAEALAVAPVAKEAIERTKETAAITIDSARISVLGIRKWNADRRIKNATEKKNDLENEVPRLKAISLMTASNSPSTAPDAPEAPATRKEIKRANKIGEKSERIFKKKKKLKDLEILWGKSPYVGETHDEELKRLNDSTVYFVGPNGRPDLGSKHNEYEKPEEKPLFVGSEKHAKHIEETTMSPQMRRGHQQAYKQARRLQGEGLGALNPRSLGREQRRIEGYIEGKNTEKAVGRTTRKINGLNSRAENISKREKQLQEQRKNRQEAARARKAAKK